MLVIGHDHFNKSLTLDIENKMMQHLLSSSGIAKLNNKRTNVQDKYYTYNELNPIFNQIWQRLNQVNSTEFPPADAIKVSALFKLSPFHKLTPEQYAAANQIEDRINQNLCKPLNSDDGTLILVEGAAGTGKTVLLSQLFNQLNRGLTKQNNDRPKAYLVVNYKEQKLVYKEIANKLGLSLLDPEIATKPSSFINQHSPSDKVDVILVDEAHLLWTQGNQGYRGSNQLEDLLKRAKVVVAIFDQNQILSNPEYIEPEKIERLRNQANKSNNLIHLKNQIRMKASPSTLEWIDNFIFNGLVGKIPQDRYDLRISDDAKKVVDAIKDHNNEFENDLNGLSRMIATFDWEYKQKIIQTENGWLELAISLCHGI